MSIVGLDIATHTGAAGWRQGDPAPRLATWRLPGGPDDLGKPMEALRQHLDQVHAWDPITLVFLEQPIVPRPRLKEGRIELKTSPQTVIKLAALCGMAEWYCVHVLKAEVWAVEQQTWRKHFIGRGTGKSEVLKPMAVDAAKQRGWKPEDDHQAEAGGILDYGLNWAGIDHPWRDSHLFGGVLQGSAAA